MSTYRILEKAIEVAFALLMFFILFFLAGFIYGTVKTSNNRIDDVISYVKIEYTNNTPSSLSVSCSSSRPSYIYNILTENINPDPAAKEEAISSFKPIIAEAIPRDPGSIMTTGSGLLGFGAAWEAFKLGHGNIKNGLIIVFGSIFGAPFGYYVATHWVNINCPSEDLFRLLDQKETWVAIVDKIFLKLIIKFITIAQIEFRIKMISIWLFTMR